MTKAGPIRVLLVDDLAMFRQGLRSALESYPNIEVVGEAEDGEQAITSATTLQPAVIVMDINMPKMDGITTTQLVKAQHPQVAVVGLSAESGEYQLYAMQKAGAFEVLSKNDSVTELYGAIQRAVASHQPILILEDVPTSEKCPAAQSEESSHPNPMDESPVRKSKQATET